MMPLTRWWASVRCGPITKKREARLSQMQSTTQPMVTRGGSSMSIYQEYNDLFDKEIVQKSKGIVFAFSPIEDKYKFHPYGHAVLDTSVEDLAGLMRHNLLFYAFGEEEVVRLYNEDIFSSLEKAAKYAYRQRLPKRADIMDGLPSEALLDLLVQIYNPNAYKLAVRTLLRQDDNNEIKGYDLTYFTKDKAGLTLWLGQAKLGSKEYCKSSINDDLLKKYTPEYLLKQLFFVCDKRVEITNDAKEILSDIDHLNILMLEEDDVSRADALIDYFKKRNIKIKIPCLLAYGDGSVYHDSDQVCAQIQFEVDSIRRYYSKHTYLFNGMVPEIIFCIFPIESIERLRNKENGFYAGLC